MRRRSFSSSSGASSSARIRPKSRQRTRKVLAIHRDVSRLRADPLEPGSARGMALDVEPPFASDLPPFLVHGNAADVWWRRSLLTAGG